MGKVRVCGATCHRAKCAKCRCWCGGVFHGKAGDAARQAFREAFNVEKIPTTEQVFRKLTGGPDLFTTLSVGDEWRGRVERESARAGCLPAAL